MLQFHESLLKGGRKKRKKEKEKKEKVSLGVISG